MGNPWDFLVDLLVPSPPSQPTNSQPAGFPNTCPPILSPIALSERMLDNFWYDIPPVGDTCRSQWYKDFNRYMDSFCQNPENIYANPGNQGSCLERSQGYEYAKDYCSSYGRITGSNKGGVCTIENLGSNYYKKLAKDFCENNTENSWCKCYNVVEEKCEDMPNSAGCAETSADWAKIKKAVPSKYWFFFENKRHCRSNLCSNDTDTYIPGGVTTVCQEPINICETTIDIAGDAIDNIINTECNINNKGGGDSANNKGGGGSGTSTVDSKDFVSNIAKEVTEKYGFGIAGVGFGSVISCMVLFLIIIIVTMSSSSSSRFRR